MNAAGVVARASAGTSELLPVFSGNPEETVKIAKALGYTVICAGIRNSVSYTDSALRKPLLLVVGGEKRGVSAGVLALCDEVVRIDYGRSFRGSLSTAAAVAVLGFEILKKNQE